MPMEIQPYLKIDKEFEYEVDVIYWDMGSELEKFIDPTQKQLEFNWGEDEPTRDI